MNLVDRFKTLRRDQFNDPRSSAIFTDLDSPSNQLHAWYKIYDGVLFFRRFVPSKQWLVCIPSIRELILIISVHEFYGHVGVKKCASVF